MAGVADVHPRACFALRTARRWSRRAWASAARCSCSSVCGSNAGSARVPPSPSSATKVQYALQQCTRWPVFRSSAITRTPISMLLRQALLTMDWSSTAMPRWMGARKCSPSMLAVTTGSPAKRMAETDAQMSIQAAN